MSSLTDTYTLKSVSDLPTPFRSTFGFRYFNSLQSECFSACFLSDINMVISAPTGSGKTVLFELCILRLLSKFISADGSFIHVKGTLKTIYIAPSKALVQEKLRDWNQKLGSWGINCLELTGDNEFYNIRSIQETDIVLTTPEKFDAVTRYRIKDGGLSFFSDIALVLIDEVHLLNDPRGAALEAIVSRIKMLACKPEMKSSPLACVRFLAVSATIPNIDDLVEWLMVPAQGVKRFGEEMRPVKLTTRVFGYTPAKNDFLFEKRLQNYIFDVLMQYSWGKSALVFCSTRRGAQEAALRLSQNAMTYGHSNPFIRSREQQERLREASLLCSDKQMQSCILYGVGYHNGGLSAKDRNLVEGLFLNGDLQVLCATNTLAHGINLPAHTVVIKSTQHFNKEKGLYMEYDRSMILQMCGRAGRPPFDDTGMVIIMTRRETVHLYENLLKGCETVESQLLSCITEHLTAEIVQLTVSDITRAIEWMKCSYLYVRMKKNPENYAMKKGLQVSRIEKHLQEICVQKINELSQCQMIWRDEDGFLLRPLEPGKVMTKYYLKFNTMKHIMQASANCSIEDALHIICRAEEFSWIQLRRTEKKLLNDINTDKDGRLRFHIHGDKGKKKKRIQTREEKIFVLANDCLTGDPLVRDLSTSQVPCLGNYIVHVYSSFHLFKALLLLLSPWTMLQDMNSICSNGCRVAKCMKEFFIYRKNYKGALNSILLAKSLHQKLWDDSPYLLKQLPGIGMVTAKALHSMGVKSFETLSEADPRKIEIVTGRKYPFGNHIKESLLSLPPKVELKVEETECQRQRKSKVVVTLTRLSEAAQSAKRHYADMVVGVEEDNLILYHEKIRLDEFSSPYSATVLLSSPLQGNLTVKVDLIFEEFIGIDVHQKVTVMKAIDTNVVNKHGKKQPSFFPQPKDVCVIKDDTDSPSQTSIKKPRDLNETTGDVDSMPSFTLIDEEIEEGVPAVEVEDDECKIITERVVFDHIRKKAKNLPVLVTANNACSPSLENFNLIRKRTRERKLELDNALENLDETDRNKIPRQTVVNPYVEPLKVEGNGENTDRYLTPKHHMSSDTICSKDAEEGISKHLTEGKIFEHIRRKAKNFQMFDKLVTAKSKTWTKAGALEDHPDFSSTNPDMFERSNANGALQETVIISDEDPMKSGQGKTCMKQGSIIDIALTSDPGSTTESSGKQLHSPSPSKRHYCSLATASDIKKVDSFLGFKSIFSFL